MNPEDKELLFKDLCARLPYGVIVRGVFINYNIGKDKILHEECDKQLNYQDLSRYESLKPYLRPMSSMTEEDNLSLSKYVGCSIRVKYGEIYFPIIEDNTPDKWEKVFDWLNAHHFDYRDLISKGLALEATEKMYN